MIAIIIFSGLGLATCLCYLVYQLICYKKVKSQPSKPVQTQKYEYCDEYEEGDSLIIHLKNY